MHGIGVSTPKAAAVAAATVGFAGDEHIPKGGIFIIGLLSIIFAAGLLPTSSLFLGSTIKLLGATPKLHIIEAPIVT
jgi:hypothetical protein